VGHAFFARDGVKLAFGKRWDGAIIHISQASRGSACGCECPAQNCGRKLIARKPESDIAHHFAHAPLTPAERAAGIAPNCKHGNMTALHAYAEQLLNSKKNLVLPPVGATFGKRSKKLRDAKNFTFDSAKLETMDGETIPDVILHKGDHRMHVEVYVTHRCGPEKRAKIVAADISAVEIDLSVLSRDVTLEGLDDAILKSAPREWIHNRKVKQLRDELERIERAEAALAEKKRRKDADDLKKAYAAAKRQALRPDWRDAAEVIEVTEAGDGKLLEGPSGGEGYFSVHPRIWKAAIVGNLLSHYAGIAPFSVVSEFRKRGWIVERFYHMNLTHDPLLAEAGLRDGGPEQVVLGFLRFLSHQGVAEDLGWTWKRTQRHSDQLLQRKRDRERALRETAERAARRKALANLGNSIALLGDDDERQNFDVAVWMDHRPGGNGLSLNQVADDGDAAWRALKAGLSTALAVLKDESEEVAEHFGLPIRSSLKAVRAAHEARAAQRKLDAEEAARLESFGRIDTIVSRAASMPGDACNSWIDAPKSKLDGLTPREAAAKSSELLARASRLLHDHVAELTKKTKWVEELEREALKLFQRQDKVALYINSSDPGLPGLVSPNVHTKDERTMRQCLALLKRRFGKR
jgi:hypothetical protein